MKILEPGNGQTGWATEARCTGSGNNNAGCGALLLVEERDLFQTGKHDYGGGSEYFVTFECPTCKQYTDLTKTPFRGKELPKHPSKCGSIGR